MDLTKEQIKEVISNEISLLFKKIFELDKLQNTSLEIYRLKIKLETLSDILSLYFNDKGKSF